MTGLIKNIVLCGLITGLIFSCSPLKRTQGERQFTGSTTETFTELCDSLKPFNTLYISNIEAEILIDDEEFNSRISLFYLPDSLFLLSAVNAGFEIVRVGIFPDSTVYINRLEKLAVVIKNKGTGYAPPVLFGDLERLVNRSLLCEDRESIRISDSTLIVDRSEPNISKKIYFSIPGTVVRKFEFFQKRTGEYVMGEMNDAGKFVIYSNYIVDDLTLYAEGGRMEYDRILDVNFSVSKKYNIVYLE